jgi:hypothetical protein
MLVLAVETLTHQFHLLLAEGKGVVQFLGDARFPLRRDERQIERVH